MNDFVFEATPWELALEEMHIGDTLSAARFLTLLEGESEETVEEAFEDLAAAHVTLDVAELPKTLGAGDTAVRLRREAELVKTGLDPAVLEPGDPLRLYLEEVAATPACGDELLLAADAAGGDERVMERLTNLGLSRVIELSKEYTGYGVLLLDLIQEGSLGLWQAIGCFDGGDYEAHRDWWIRQSLARAVTMQARQSGVGHKLRQAMEDYRSVDERLLCDLGRNPTVEEIAEEMHISVQEAAAVAKMVENARMMGKVHTPEVEDDPAEEEAHVEDTALFQMRQRIAELLEGVSEEDAKLLTLRFGLEGGLPLSPADTGRKLGLTPEEVVAREAAALSMLRNQ